MEFTKRLLLQTGKARQKLVDVLHCRVCAINRGPQTVGFALRRVVHLLQSLLDFRRGPRRRLSKLIAVPRRFRAHALAQLRNQAVRMFLQRRRKPLPECRFLDVSVTGARLLAPETQDLGVGSQMVLDYDGESTRVKIRRVEACNNTFSVYGVSFIELGPRLKEVVYAADIERSRRHEKIAG